MPSIYSLSFPFLSSLVYSLCFYFSLYFFLLFLYCFFRYSFIYLSAFFVIFLFLFILRVFLVYPAFYAAVVAVSTYAACGLVWRQLLHSTPDRQ